MVTEIQSMAPMMINKVSSTSNLSKQVLACITTGLLCLCVGFTFGCNAVVPSTKDDLNISHPDDDDSFDLYGRKATMTFLPMAIGCISAGVLCDYFGRKYTHILLLWPFLVGYLILAFTKNATYLVIGRFLTAMCSGVFRIAGSVYLAEISDTMLRPISQCVLSIATSIGILGSHSIGGYLSQRHSNLIFSSPIILAFIFLVFTKESPLWLISKGKIEEGVESFDWFRSKHEVSRKELTAIVEKRKNTKESSNILRVIFTLKFLKGFCTSLCLFIIIQFYGFNNLTFYALDLLKPTFSFKISPFLLMIIFDCIRLLGNVTSIPLLKYYSRRMSFFIMTSIVIVLLIGIMTYLILDINIKLLLFISWITFTFVSGILICLSWTFVVEIFPNEIRGIGLGLSAATSFLLFLMLATFGIDLLKNCGLVSVNVIVAIVTLITLIALKFLLPDNEGKSLHEM